MHQVNETLGHGEVIGTIAGVFLRAKFCNKNRQHIRRPVQRIQVNIPVACGVKMECVHDVIKT